MMFNKLTNFAKPTIVPDDIEAIVSSVSKSPELIGAEEKLATLRARHTEIYDKIRSLNSTRGKQIDAHQESKRDREVEKLTEERIEVEEQIREAKANRNDLSWPWKLAVAEAAKPMLEVKAKELRDHIVEVKKLTAEFIDITVRFPGSINQIIPMSHPGVQGWLEFARKILGEKIL